MGFRRGLAATLIVSLTFLPVALAQDREPLAFSALQPELQERINHRTKAPPLGQREAPYSTPMYYLLAKGFADGPNNEVLLHRSRPDWQEVLVKDWAELGLTSTLYATGPTEWDDPETVQAILDYCKLSRKYGLKVGVRLAGDGKFQGIDAGGWDVHPRNPNNRIKEYVQWVGRVAQILKGQVDHYTLGDELNSGGWEESGEPGKSIAKQASDDQRWQPADYMIVFRQVAQAIKSADPQAKVSMFGMNGLDWRYVDGLFRLGYGDFADGVAANPDDHKFPFEAIHDFVNNVRAVKPGFALYSNGVGYVGVKTDISNPSNAPGYKRLEEDEQAARVAQMMVTMFDVKWTSTPYYIIVRQWRLPDGRVAPHWYGFFGFCDLVVNNDDSLSVKRYPAWYALQTVANTLHSRSKTVEADFKPKLSQPVDHCLCYVRNDYECLLVLWNKARNKPMSTTVTVPTRKFTYPVRIPLDDYRKPVSVAYRVDTNSIVLPEVQISDAPTIIRMVAETQQYSE